MQFFAYDQNDTCKQCRRCLYRSHLETATVLRYASFAIYLARAKKAKGQDFQRNHL